MRNVIYFQQICYTHHNSISHTCLNILYRLPKTNMKLVLLGSLLLILSACGQLAFFESTEIFCSVTMELTDCSSLPRFNDGCEIGETIPTNLLRFCYAKDLEAKFPNKFNTLKYIVTRRFQFQLAYDRIERAIELQLKADQCCINPKVMIKFKYMRQQSTDACPSLLYENPDRTLGCMPVLIGFFNVLFVNNLVLVRKRYFALLLVSHQIRAQRFSEDQFKWFEQLIEFGMWTGVDILHESPPATCNCSTNEGFKEWLTICRSVHVAASRQYLPLYNISVIVFLVKALMTYFQK